MLIQSDLHWLNQSRSRTEQRQHNKDYNPTEKCRPVWPLRHGEKGDKKRPVAFARFDDELRQSPRLLQSGEGYAETQHIKR